MALGKEVGLGSDHIVPDGDRAPSQKGQSLPNFRPSIVAKRLHGSICHSVLGQASAHATLCYMGTQLSPKKRHSSPSPSFLPMSILWSNGRASQLLLSCCWFKHTRITDACCVLRVVYFVYFCSLVCVCLFVCHYYLYYLKWSIKMNTYLPGRELVALAVLSL